MHEKRERITLHPLVPMECIILLIITRSELALVAHSLYTCIKHYINDCAVEKFQLGHVAARRGRLKH